MSLSVTILGCGSSGGVPRVGQGWGACDPNDERNRRRRCSILVSRKAAEDRVTQVLVDMSPDLRDQLLDAKVGHLDSILLTHPHADHTHGIDDVRPLALKMKSRIDVHMDVPTAAVVETKFAYIFTAPPDSKYPPLLTLRTISGDQPILVEGPGGLITARPFRLAHGDIDALGYRFGTLAYTPDVNAIPDESVDALKGLDIWIVDALRYTRHPSHFSLSETLEWIERLRPRRAILTNLHTDMDFSELTARLPPNVEPAFDGMVLDL